MKKELLILSKGKKAAVIFGVVVITAAALYLLFFRTSIAKDSNATVVFKYDKINIETQLSSEDRDQIRDFFDNKILYKDMPSCGFSEDISVRFTDPKNGKQQTFCIARNTCPVIYLAQSDMYFRISDEDRAELNKILEKYGAFFTCI